jgi:hypothetical protein
MWGPPVVPNECASCKPFTSQVTSGCASSHPLVIVFRNISTVRATPLRTTLSCVRANRNAAWWAVSTAITCLTTISAISRNQTNRGKALGARQVSALIEGIGRQMVLIVETAQRAPVEDPVAGKIQWR